MLITIKDERFGLVAYIKNYVLNSLILAFILIYVGFVTLLAYFWLTVLSLHTSLRKFNQQKGRAAAGNGRILLAQSQNHTATSLAEANAATTIDVMTNEQRTNSMRLIPIEVVNGPLIASMLNNNNNESTPSKFFILHV